LSYEELVRAHAADLYRYAYWLARERAAAEDLLQEALLRGWRAFGGLRDPAAAKGWLFSIVRNEFLRARAGAPRHESLDEGLPEIADERGALFALEMRDAIRALPASYAEPLALQVLGGFSCAEIAAMLGTTEGAVMARLTRARQALRRMIEPAAARARRGERA
jgi:RNA polymerase sigma-70 factor (ECF subfamily)